MVTIGIGRDDPRAWVKAAYLILDAMEGGDKLPSRPEIAGKLGIHEMTVRRAYREMVGMDLIRMVPGHGYYPIVRLHCERAPAYRRNRNKQS